MAGDYDIWVEDPLDVAPGGGVPTGPTGRPSTGPGTPHFPRWIAVAVGFALVGGLIVAQHQLSGRDGTSATPVGTPTISTADSTTPQTTAAVTSSESTRDPAFRTPPASPATVSPPVAPSLSRSAPPGPAGITATGSLAAPSITFAPVLDLPGEPFQVTGLTWNGAMGPDASVIRYRSDTGMVERTEIPALMSSGPMSLVSTSTSTIVRPWDTAPGYLIPSGAPAEIAGGVLGQSALALPAESPDRLWAATQDGNGVRAVLLDPAGHPTGPIMTTPTTVGMQTVWNLTPDGGGGILTTGIGGSYDLRPGEVRLVTHGAVLAVGPTGFLVYECRDDAAQCSAFVLDRDTWRRTQLPGHAVGSPFVGNTVGVMSPDGRYAAMFDPGTGGSPLSVTDLRSGAAKPIRAPSNGPIFRDASAIVAFTPDSHYLLAAAGPGVVLVDPATGTVLQTLPIPSIGALTVTPVE